MKKVKIVLIILAAMWLIGKIVEFSVTNKAVSQTNKKRGETNIVSTVNFDNWKRIKVTGKMDEKSSEDEFYFTSSSFAYGEIITDKNGEVTLNMLIDGERKSVYNVSAIVIQEYAK